MSKLKRVVRAACTLPVLSLLLLDAQLRAQSMTSTDRAQMREIVHRAQEVLRTNYYDPSFRGIDLKAHFKVVQEKAEKAGTVPMAYAAIAQGLLDFNDSHTYFIPPRRAETYEYGWQMQMIGDDCYVVAVQPGSDAEAKGVKPGDRVVRVEQFVPTRRDLWKLQYAYSLLAPRPVFDVATQSPGGPARDLQLVTRITQGRHEIRLHKDREDLGLGDEYRKAMVGVSRTARAGGIAIWKLGAFTLEPQDVDAVFDAATRGAAALVIDLRGNPGGYVKTLENIAGRLFERDVTIADVKGRRSSRRIVARKRRNPFTGSVAVLVDSNSASSAEILARVIQLESRGTVIGDRSAGAVMQSIRLPGVLEAAGGFIPFEISVTEADLIMKDGKSLEGIGVTPDELLLPTAADLAAGRDPVLSRAVALLGGTLDPLAAGALFPVIWK